MKPSRTRKRNTTITPILAIGAGLLLLVIIGGSWWFWHRSNETASVLKYASTIAGTKGEFGEPFGIAVKGREIYVSDGQNGKIWRLTDGTPAVFAEGLDTPSGIAFDKDGNLLVADSGSSTIKSINPSGGVMTVAGVENRAGFADGDADAALFNAPIGLAIGKDGKIFVADTYNDRIRLIENGKVLTLAGSTVGYAEGPGAQAKFDTPCGITVWQDKLLVADAGNWRIRVVESDGRVWTLAGDGGVDLKDGLLLESSFVQPTAIAIDKNDRIFVADGNAIRQIGGGAFPTVRTISSEWRGLKDGVASKSRFNRPSGLAIDGAGNLLITDSENRLVRKFSSASSIHEITDDEIAALRDKPEDFRVAQPARWPYDPPAAKRDIAGTLGELRGEIKPGNDDIHFHNGLDIAGGYGETARFVREEKVLRPIAVDNFGNLRESIRMPTMGYIHIRLGRDKDGIALPDEGGRFQFTLDASRKIIGVRVPRGAYFKAGEPIGTLNPMNHVHLIAGRSGSEMNALDALILPGLTDSRPPTIENVTIFDQNWRQIETASKDQRIKLSGKTRIVVRAYDQADGNSERRRLGVYKVGYQLIKPDGVAVADVNWTIIFDRLPAAAAVPLVYANGSKSGATGETIFNYIVTNHVRGDDFREDFFDTLSLTPGAYTLRVMVADYFGNISNKDISIEVVR